jgi:hypothetical protein
VYSWYARCLEVCGSGRESSSCHGHVFILVANSVGNLLVSEYSVRRFWYMPRRPVYYDEGWTIKLDFPI